MSSVNDFKTGDRIRYVGKHPTVNSADYIGLTGVVAERTEYMSPDVVPVKFDNDPLEHGIVRRFFPENLEKIEAAEDTADLVTKTRAMATARRAEANLVLLLCQAAELRPLGPEDAALVKRRREEAQALLLICDMADATADAIEAKTAA